MSGMFNSAIGSPEDSSNKSSSAFSTSGQITSSPVFSMGDAARINAGASDGSASGAGSAGVPADSADNGKLKMLAIIALAVGFVAWMKWGHGNGK